MKLFTTSIFILFLGVLTTFSQHSISGKIVDDQNISLPFANIVLYKIGEEANPKGTVSNDKGEFTFDKITSGNYKMQFSMLGFKTQNIDEFTLNENKTFNITLKEESQTLNEVVIKSKKPIIKQTAEKLIVDLENSEMINTNLQDVMRKVPGILVTNNGISIAGNSGVRILINGKTTEYMDVDTLLRDFPADNIAKIEVVEQPGAEYEASGSGAIINIILKKNVKLGTHGSANTWVGEDQGFEWGSGFSIASYKNKLNWQTSIGYSQPTFREDLFLVRTVGNETYDQVTKEPYDPDNFRISGSMDYYLNDKNSIGIGASLNTRNSTRIASSETIISDENSVNTIFSENSFNRERNNYNINPYYEYKSETDRLLVDFNYIDFVNDNTNTLYDVAGSTIPFTDRKYIQNGNYNIKT
ncbi:MAG: TonB-dependent receptor, partial [Flavobacteriales bacterium]